MREPGVLEGGFQPMMVMSRSVSQVNSCWRDLRLGLAAGVGGEVFHEADEAGSSPSVIMRTRWITHIGSAAFALPPGLCRRPVPGPGASRVDLTMKRRGSSLVRTARDIVSPSGHRAQEFSKDSQQSSSDAGALWMPKNSLWVPKE